MCKGSIVGASHKISAKNMDHSLAGMEWRFTNRSNQRLPPTGEGCWRGGGSNSQTRLSC